MQVENRPDNKKTKKRKNDKMANLNYKDFARNRRGLKIKEVFDDEENLDEEASNLAGKGAYLKNKRINYVPKDVEKWSKENNFEDFDKLFENERVIIINKPVNIMVHPDDRSDEVTISDIVYDKYPDLRTVGEGDRFAIVHRLDRDTSGVLALCKNEAAFKEMKGLFYNHKIRKVYRAIVEGNLREDMGIIDSPIARARSDFRKKAVVDMFSKDFRGKEREALTRYKVLARSEDKKFTYVELYPLTGRTHQLRVHLRSIRHPIIGDELYGSKDSTSLAPRCMLHAYKLEFILRKENIEVVAPMPDDMQKVLLQYFGDKI